MRQRLTVLFAGVTLGLLAKWIGWLIAYAPQLGGK
jgi:hypothetical protein